jgi:hypothetical protein
MLVRQMQGHTDTIEPSYRLYGSGGQRAGNPIDPIHATAENDRVNY